MSITVSFGNWTEERTYDSPDKSAGQLWRKGFALSWAKPLDPGILFSFRFQFRFNGVEMQQTIAIRENPNA